MIQHLQPTAEPVKISDQGKAVIIAELQEVIKIIDIENLTTIELNEAWCKHQFVGRLIDLYLNDAVRICQLNPRDTFDPRQQPGMVNTPLQFQNPMYPIGYPDQRMQSIYPQQYLGQNFNELQQPVNPSNLMNGTVMQNFMGQHNNSLNQTPAFGDYRPINQIQWAEFSDTLLFAFEVRPAVNGKVLVILFSKRPADGIEPSIYLEVDAISHECRVFNGFEVVKTNRLDMATINKALKKLVNDYICGDKPTPMLSPTSAPLWHTIKEGNPAGYGEWCIVNINCVKIGHITFPAKQQA